MGVDVVDAAAVHLDQLAHRVGMLGGELARRHADQPGHARNEIGEMEDDAVLVGLEREDRIDQRRRIDAAGIEQREPAAEPAGADRLDLADHAGFLERQPQQQSRWSTSDW